MEQSYLISSPFAIYGPTITVTQLSNLSTWAFPVFYKNILDGGITPDVWLIKVHTYITFESTESMLSFEKTLALDLGIIQFIWIFILDNTSI